MMLIENKISDDVCNEPSARQPVGRPTCDETRQSAISLTLVSDRVPVLVPDIEQTRCSPDKRHRSQSLQEACSTVSRLKASAST